MASPVPQAAVIPVRDGRICLVTSRNGARWVFPKGRIEVRQTAPQAALTEAWEEAGLRGDLTGEPIGTYRYEKRGRTHHVTVFVMDVVSVTNDYPESGERVRDWVTPEHAAELVDEPELKALVRAAFGIEVPVGSNLRSG